MREHLLDVKNKQWIDLYGNGMTLNDFRFNNRLAKLSLRLLGRNITASAHHGTQHSM